MGTGKATRNTSADNRFNIDAQRGLLAVLTSGTSEIKTGAGEYGDETVADSLFPKTVNNWMLNDRQAAREDADVKAKADAEALKPPPPPDPSSKLTMQAQRAAMLRTKAKQGRKNAFSTGDPYGVKG